MSNKANLNLCVIAFPTQNPVPLTTLLTTLEKLADSIVVITGNFPSQAVSSHKIVITNVKHDPKQQPMLLRIPRYVIIQLKIMYYLIKMRAKFNIALFYIGGSGLILPMLAAKTVRKKIILIMPGSIVRSAGEIYKKSLWGAGAPIFTRLFSVLEKISCRLSTRIVVYSPSLISFSKLEKYRSKIQVAHEHFIDFDAFRIERALDERDYLIGYIGRLSQEKGVINFVRAIPRVLDARKGARFLMIGQGPLCSEVEELLKEYNLDDKAGLLDWVPHSEIPKYINQLKLLVLPSYTEGLPNIVLEAMACGTPVLVMPVGSIPDLIKDEETGFILEDNTPESIARSILRALKHPKLDEVAANARRLVEQNYTYEAAVAGYRKVLVSLKAR